MAKLIHGFHIFRRFRAVVEAIDAIDINKTALSATLQYLTADGRTKTMAHKDDIPHIFLVQHRIDGLGKEVERVLHMWLTALAIARQVNEQQAQMTVIAQSLELLLPSIEVAAEAMNETDGLVAIAISLIMYANAIVDRCIR